MVGLFIRMAPVPGALLEVPAGLSYGTERSPAALIDHGEILSHKGIEAVTIALQI